PYRWGVDEYGLLLRTTGGQHRIDGYLAGQGVAAEERRQLAPALHRRKTEIMSGLVAEGRVEGRPGGPRLLHDLLEPDVRLPLPTTGSGGWVGDLLVHLLPGIPFAVTVCGDEVTHRKPDPEAFTLALERLGGLPPDQAAVVEDSHEGVTAATGAHLACV